jgi:hypothetical protein
MNRQAKHILELGLFFAGAVIILDMLLTQMPVLDWFALGFTFSLMATLILSSVARTVPWQTHKTMLSLRKEDEFQHLANVVDAAVYAHDGKSLKILSNHLKSLALGAIAARTRLSKKDILELAENNLPSLQAIVQDEGMVNLLAGYHEQDEALNQKELEQTLSKIESWSR